MLQEVILVHFSFLSASFADTLINVVDHPNTRQYSSEWQFRENFIRTGISIDPNSKSSTTEKVIQYANGWRPITSSRSVHHDREPRSRSHHHFGPVVQIGGHREKPQPFKSWKRSPDRQAEYSASTNIVSKIRPIPIMRNQPFPFSFARSTLPNATNILPHIRHNSYPIDRATNTGENSRSPPLDHYTADRKKKSKKVMKEDEIMWMHYALDHAPKALPFVSNDLPEVRQLDHYDTDMLMQETQDDTGPFVVYSSSTGIAEPIQSSTEDIFTTLATPRPYHSRNSYEIIDVNNKDNFRPMTTTTQGDVVTRTANEDAISWPDFRNIFSTSEPATEYNLVSSQSSDSRLSTGMPMMQGGQIDSDSRRNRRLFNVTNLENVSQEYSWPKKSTSDNQIKIADNEPRKKAHKYFTKPIVITETAPEDDYFTKLLFDSFGGGERKDERAGGENLNALMPNQRADENEIKENATETIERNDNELSAEQTETKFNLPIKNFTASDDYKVDEVVVKKKVRMNDETWNFLFNATEGVRFADLIPVTLKTNMFLVKKLMVECYSDSDGTDSRGSTINCLKKITFKVLDRAVESDVVKITDSVILVKDNNTAVDRLTRSVSDDTSDWLSSFLEKVQRLFSTHSLQVKLANPREMESLQVEGRRRHRFRRVFPVVAGIYMTITAVVIPIVFQFMAMMGGKSFVISNLALLFALFSSFSKFFTASTENHHHQQHHSLPLPPLLPPPLPYPPYHYDQHAAKRKSDKRFKRIPIDYNYSYYVVDQAK